MCSKFAISSLAIELIEKAAKVLSVAVELEKPIETPKWLCPLAVLLDLYEKFAAGFKMRNELLARPSGRVWKTFQVMENNPYTFQTKFNHFHLFRNDLFVGTHLIPQTTV